MNCSNTPTRNVSALASALLLALLVASTGAAVASTACFTAALDGDQENPPVTTDAAGSGNFTYDFAAGELNWTIIHDLDMAEVTAAHIHVGAVGVNGPIVIGLDHNDNPMRGSAVLDEEQETELTGELWYVNVHTNDHPGGEIRGQMLNMAGACFIASLDGAQENPPVATDAMGSGILEYDFGTRQLSWSVIHDLDMAEVTAAHIHLGEIGVNGPIVIPLDHTENPISGSALLDEAQEADLTAGLYYVNVHTQAHPGGEIRGQILAAAMDGEVFLDRFEAN